ncbi:DUF551 domain-containing protein [Rosenbergiella epipactidis]|uniref:DUF551 domain-containing protein n=1 Tax=Rosenbergiella epipactidis TaxID=1544694 RepID=UPI0034DDEFB3
MFGVTIPTVELESKWIKCSEQMPEDGKYLCFKSGNIDVCTIIYGNWIINSFVDTKVTHWMPLPPPPTEYPL